jgi:hypothetical protein
LQQERKVCNTELTITIRKGNAAHRCRGEAATKRTTVPAIHLVAN